MAAPLRTERRPVRPFRSVAPFQRALSKIVFAVGSQEVEESVTLTQNDLLTASFTVRPDFDTGELENGLESIQLVPEAISLLVFARSRTLKQTEVILFESLSTSLERGGAEISIEPSAKPLLFADVSAGFSIDVALVLAETIPHEPLKPYLKGTWLGRRTFDVHVERDDALFVPVPLDDARRRELNLPAGTMSYVRFEPDRSPLEATDIEELLEFLVDDGVLGHIKQVEQSPEARLVMTQLAAELLTAILMRGVRDLEDDNIQLRMEVDGRPSVFDRVIARVAEGQAGVDAARLAEWSKTDPDRVSALVAHAVSLQSETLSMIAGTT